MRQQIENELLIQDPRVTALLKAIDDAHFIKEGGVVVKAILNARAAFAPPVEMEYTMPSWDEINPASSAYLITKETYEKAREQTRRHRCC